MIRRRDGGSLALAWSLDGPILSSRRAFHTQRDVAAFADEQIEALRNANQSAERDGVNVQNRRRTTWCDLLTRAVERNAGEVAGAHANRAIFTHFGAWGGDGDGLGHPFERLAAHIVERVEEAREIRRRAGDGSSRAATPRSRTHPSVRVLAKREPETKRELATKILPKKAERAPPDARRCPTATASPDLRISRLGTLHLRGKRSPFRAFVMLHPRRRSPTRTRLSPRRRNLHRRFVDRLFRLRRITTRETRRAPRRRRRPRSGQSGGESA